MRLKIKNNTFNVKTMLTQEQWSEGMMGKKFNDKVNGMLFLMSDGPHCFYMKNCVIPLDIIFIQDNVITNIHHNCPPCKTKDCDNYCGHGDAILEVDGNTCKKLGIKIGDKISV
jgi:uncharacterized membrane protein (UPF0127 family)